MAPISKALPVREVCLENTPRHVDVVLTLKLSFFSQSVDVTDHVILVDLIITLRIIHLLHARIHLLHARIHLLHVRNIFQKSDIS